MSEFPNWAPDVSPETKPFWDATKDDRLLLSHCPACERAIWYPRARCPHCLSVETEWIEASGVGTIYSHSHVHQAAGTFGDAAPYVIAYVELAEGPRMLTNIVDADPERLSVGQPVEVVFHETEGEYKLPRFTPR